MSVSPVSFVLSAFLAQRPDVDRLTADAQSFGVVQVDAAGVATLYDRWESGLCGTPVSAAGGRNVFTHVASCTNHRLMFGTFKGGAAQGELDNRFTPTFTQDEADEMQRTAGQRELALAVEPLERPGDAAVDVRDGLRDVSLAQGDS